MTRIAIIFIGLIYSSMGFAENDSCLSRLLAGGTDAQYQACVVARTTASTATTSSMTSTSTSAASAGQIRCQAMIPECGYFGIQPGGRGGMNFGSLYYLLILSDYFPDLKQYLEYAFLQQYLQLYWLSYWYGGSAVEAFKHLYGFNQPVYAQSAAATAPGATPPGYSQQNAFANFLRLAFLQPTSASTTGSTNRSPSGSSTGSTRVPTGGSTTSLPTGRIRP